MRPPRQRRWAPWPAACCAARRRCQQCSSASARPSASRRSPSWRRRQATDRATSAATGGATGGWVVVASAGVQPCQRPQDADTQVPAGESLMLAIRGRSLHAEDQRVVGAFAAQAAVILERSRLSEAAAAVAPLAEADRMRTALLAAVGHDLRSPLASAKAAVTSLRSDEVPWSPRDRSELLADRGRVAGPAVTTGRQPARHESAPGWRLDDPEWPGGPRRSGAVGPRRARSRRSGRWSSMCPTTCLWCRRTPACSSG